MAFVRVASVVIVILGELVAVGPVAIAGPVPVPVPIRTTARVVLPAPVGAMAEPTVAIDPRNPTRMAVAANPYLHPARIQISTSSDAGQNWSEPKTVIPPGDRKSYDPQLGYAADGSLLVTGGASPDTRSGCQRASEIFVAVLHGDRFSYRVLAKAPADALLDRPTLLATEERKQRILVAWTASQGPGAECALRPVRSRTEVVLLTSGLGAGPAVTLPRVAQAPFGSALAVSGDGVLGLAVAGRDGSNGITMGVYQSADGMHWRFDPAGSAQAEPDKLAGLGGAVLSMPSVAGLQHGFVVAWTDTGKGSPRTRIARNDSGLWRQVAPPPADETRLLPTLATAGDELFLIQAGLGPAGLTFYTWQHNGKAWISAAKEKGGNASKRQEVGEALGLAASVDGSRATAVPVELTGSSAVLVRRWTLLPAPASSTSPTAKKSVAVLGRPQPRGPSTGTNVLLGLGTFCALLVVSLVMVRRRSCTGL